MSTLSFKVKEISKGIFHVKIEDDFLRAMVFLKPQEYYESESKKFRGKKFSFFDFFEWYGKKRSGFTYFEDWAGFNIPLSAALIFKGDKETPYDFVLNQIIDEIEKKSSEKKAYIISSNSKNSSVFSHELCHGLFYVDGEYKANSLSLIEELSKDVLKKFKTKLKSMGYHKSVFNDEIQAYCAYGYKSLSLQLSSKEEAIIEEIGNKIRKMIDEKI